MPSIFPPSNSLAVPALCQALRVPASASRHQVAHLCQQGVPAVCLFLPDLSHLGSASTSGKVYGNLAFPTLDRNHDLPAGQLQVKLLSCTATVHPHKRRQPY